MKTEACWAVELRKQMEAALDKYNPAAAGGERNSSLWRWQRTPAFTSYSESPSAGVWFFADIVGSLGRLDSSFTHQSEIPEVSWCEISLGLPSLLPILSKTQDMLGHGSL